MPDIKNVNYYMTSYFNPDKRWIVWAMHIIVALVFFVMGGLYLGFKEQNKDQKDLNTISEATAWIIIVFAILMITYHGDLLFMWKRSLII